VYTLMLYDCHDITQLDGQKVSIFIVISSEGISLCINHMVKTRRCFFMIHASVQPMLSLWSSNKHSLMHNTIISNCCSTLKCTSLIKSPCHAFDKTTMKQHFLWYLQSRRKNHAVIHQRLVVASTERKNDHL
jgi:hypothetical protein